MFAMFGSSPARGFAAGTRPLSARRGDDDLDDDDDVDDELEEDDLDDDDFDDELLDLDDEFDDEVEERPRPGHHRYDE